MLVFVIIARKVRVLLSTKEGSKLEIVLVLVPALSYQAQWVLRVMAFDFKVVYRPGQQNIADSLSRLKQPSSNSPPSTNSTPEVDAAYCIAKSSVPRSMTVRELEQASVVDAELTAVRHCILSGDLSSCPNPAFANVKNELCIVGQLLLRGDRIVVPSAFCARVVSLAHEGHQGTTKTNALLRTKVWWPRMDAEADGMCRTCHECEVVDSATQMTPMSRSQMATQAWQDCSADLLGPLPSGEHILVIVDYYSRYFETVVLKTVTAAKLFEGLNPIFALWGSPFTRRTDNGAQFVSAEFQKFLCEHGVEHCSIRSYWPQANGEVERQNRTLLKALRIAAVSGPPWQAELFRFLTTYRATPHSSTRKSPFELMCGRQIKAKLPALPTAVHDEAVRDADWSRKLADHHFRTHSERARESTVSFGDSVLAKRLERKNKLTSLFHLAPAIVRSRESEEVCVERPDGSFLRCHTSHVKPFHKPVPAAESQPVVPQSGDPDAPLQQPEVAESHEPVADRQRRERRTPGY